MNDDGNGDLDYSGNGGYHSDSDDGGRGDVNTDARLIALMANGGNLPSSGVAGSATTTIATSSPVSSLSSLPSSSPVDRAATQTKR